ncbi:MAG TPA: hypothetical protein PK263_05640 [bacterium]|jgi:hypothetical protein|nr:hypothetical protein [bacterium]
MERTNNRLEETTSALIVVNPSSREENIYLIREVVTSSYGALFRSDLNLSRDTPVQVIFRLKYGPEQETIKVKIAGRVVRSDPGGFTVEFL